MACHLNCLVGEEIEYLAHLGFIKSFSGINYMSMLRLCTWILFEVIHWLAMIMSNLTLENISTCVCI